ncbi:hypothetical protein N0V88_000102 [Collariella sp. IMI 366227]|nr:hypothetical protein N0V88_000102 [Collariella sp. IMI 366227]
MPESPRRRSRSRSRSPPRRPKASGGFKWKDKRSADTDNRRDDRSLQRGYRDRSPRRDRERDRDRDDRSGDRYRRSNDRDRSPGSRRNRSPRRDSQHQDQPHQQPPKPRKEKPAAAAAAAKPKPPPVQNPGEEMIIVTVNDRLGTKAQIPAFPSDTVGQFKIMVAMKVGREPHEILLKRQGERPFKDQITLGDYGVSNGVQLDLEVDTGG